jgi:CheY-like chemotaxis protein
MQNASTAERRIESGPLTAQRVLPSPRILLVVDDDLLGRDLADSLESLGYAVDDILTSALAPLEEGFRLRSDIVLVDLELRGQIAPQSRAAAPNLRQVQFLLRPPPGLR